MFVSLKKARNDRGSNGHGPLFFLKFLSSVESLALNFKIKNKNTKKSYLGPKLGCKVRLAELSKNTNTSC